MDTEIIILAQGNQARMGKDVGYKQLLPLQDCANTPILCRTIRQVRSYTGGNQATIRLVAWNQISALATHASRNLNVTRVELDDPGNSSLKGLSRWFDRRDWIGTALPQRTIVLLGDVVYSWACLDALWTLAETYGFVGTPDLSSSTGELWGVAWSYAENAFMRQQLREAMSHHPPFTAYQPGQLRRLIAGGVRGEIAGHVGAHRRLSHYVDIADYTMDVDVPEHIPFLIPASTLARDDDAAHGMSW